MKLEQLSIDFPPHISVENREDASREERAQLGACDDASIATSERAPSTQVEGKKRTITQTIVLTRASTMPEKTVYNHKRPCASDRSGNPFLRPLRAKKIEANSAVPVSGRRPMH